MNNKTYIELLKQYQAGSISEKNRHILERAALDDPFLFEAMEGYSNYGSTADNHALEQLKKSKPASSSKIMWFNMRSLSVAATLIVLVAVTFILKSQLSQDIDNNNSIANNQIVLEENQPIAQSIPQSDSDELTGETQNNTESIAEFELINNEPVEKNNYTSTSKEKVSEAKQNKPLKKTSSNSNTSNISPKRSENNKDVPSVKLENPSKQEKSKIVEVEEEIMDTEMAITPQSGMSTRSKTRAAKPEEDAITYAQTDGKGNYILGKVLDTDGNSLVGASVYIENTEIGAVTDIDGNFKLPKYDSGYQMIANYTGYKTQKILLGDSDFYQIVMPSSQSPLSEITVSPIQEVSISKAFPSMGLYEFEIYIKDNKEYPLEVFGTTRSRKTKVSFTVNTDGSLSNFTDETQQCKECFEEAVKLLEGSGRWETIPSGEKYKTSYWFEF